MINSLWPELFDWSSLYQVMAFLSASRLSMTWTTAKLSMIKVLWTRSQILVWLNILNHTIPLKILLSKWLKCFIWHERVNTLRPRQNGHYFADDIFKGILLNENVLISIKISLKFILKGPINNIAALVQVMAWRRPGDKPLSEPMMVSLLMHICVTRSQWVKQPLIKIWWLNAEDTLLNALILAIELRLFRIKPWKWCRKFCPVHLYAAKL